MKVESSESVSEAEDSPGTCNSTVQVVELLGLLIQVWTDFYNRISLQLDKQSATERFVLRWQKPGTVFCQKWCHQWHCRHLNKLKTYLLFTFISRHVISPHCSHIDVQWLQCICICSLKFLIDWLNKSLYALFYPEYLLNDFYWVYEADSVCCHHACICYFMHMTHFNKTVMHWTVLFLVVL